MRVNDMHRSPALAPPSDPGGAAQSALSGTPDADDPKRWTRACGRRHPPLHAGPGERAARGVLVLDEVGEMSLSAFTAFDRVK